MAGADGKKSQVWIAAPESATGVSAIEFHARAACESDAPEPVHQLRVSTRRSLAFLRMCEGPERGALIDDLKVPFRQAGAVRDLDVTIGLIEAESSRLDKDLQSGANAIAARLRRRRGLARAALRRSLRSSRFRRATNQLKQLADTTRTSIPPVDEKQLKRRKKALRMAAKAAFKSADAAAFHVMRLKAKQLRYSIEPLGFNVGPVVAYLKRLRRLQTALGEYHDLNVAGAVATEVAGELESTRAIDAAHALVVQFDDRGRKLLKSVPALYEKTRGKSWRQARKALLETAAEAA